MKNKFNKAIGMLNVLIASSFLTSCDFLDNKAMNGTNDTKRNGLHIEEEQILTSGNNKHQHEQAKCPSCEGSYRYFYTLADKSIILICEECNCIWVNPEKIDLANATGVKKFNEELFEEKSSKWSSKEEVEKSRWLDIARENELLIRPVS